MGRKSAVSRRIELLDETLNQIRILGVSTVRVSDVANALGVSPALIMYHFDTKDNLLVEALIHATERDLSTLGSLVRAADSPPGRLMAALEWYAPTGEARGWQIWIDAWSAAMRDKTLAKVLTDLQERWIDEIAGAIDEGVRTSLFRTDDSRAAAMRMTALLDGIAVRMVVHNAKFKREQLRAWLIRSVAWELGADPEVLSPPAV